MRRSIHWKRLLIVLGVVIVLSGGLFTLNRVQAKRQASHIKSLAQNSLQSIDGDNGKLAEAIERYKGYTRFVPDDEEAAIQLAKLLLDQQKSDPSPQNAGAAITGVEAALRRFPEHPVERRQLAELYLKTGKVRNARDHIEFLFNTPKGDFRRDVDLLEMASVCEQVTGELSQAIELLEQAIQTERPPVRIYEKVLRLLNANKSDGQRESKIATHIRELRERAPFSTDVQARITIARFELFRHEFVNAQADIDFARTKLPGGENNPDVLLAAAELEIAAIQTNEEVKPRYATAQGLLQRAFQIDTKNIQVGLMLADIQGKLGEKTQAVQTLQETSKAFGPVTDSYWVLIDRLIDLKNQDTAQALIERPGALAKDDPLAKYYRGRLALQKEDWTEAKKLLEESAPALIRLPEHHKRAMASLGLVYRNLQNPDQELDAFRAALRDDGSYLIAHVGEAEALSRLGRLDEAITRYQALVTAYQIEELRPILARLRLVDLLRKPAANRNWAKFDSEDTFGKPEKRTSELWILAAQGLAARGERERAVGMLNEVLKTEKNESVKSLAWVALARIQEAGRPDAAIVVLADARKNIGDTVDLRLAQAEALTYRPKVPTRDEFDELGVKAERFSKEDQFRLWHGLGQSAMNTQSRLASGDENVKARKALLDGAIEYLRSAAQADPRDLQSRALLIDVALMAERKEVVEPTIAELAALEGPDGPFSTLARVRIRLDDVKSIDNPKLWTENIKELRELTKKVIQKRPYWNRAYVALGHLDELEGLNDQAVEHYRQSINEGERDPAVIRRTVALYRGRKQDAAAAAMLDELSTKMILPEDLDRFRVLFEMVNRTVPRSEKPTIDRIAPETSEDPRVLLLRGSLLAAIREDEASLRALRLAINKSDNTPEAWEALIRQLVRLSDFAGAKKALSEADSVLLPALKKPEKPAAEKADLLIALGECCELCGDMKTALMRYEEALGYGPKELKPNKQMVLFLLRTGQQQEGDRLLSKLADDPSQDLARWARRYLASYAMMARPDAYQKREAALALIAKNLAASPNDAEDIKARAVILTLDPATREEGIQTLKDYWGRGDLTPDESYHLGTLIFSMGPTRLVESIKYFESAAKPRPSVTTEHIAGLVRVYAAMDKLDTAERTLERLRANAPTGWETTREEARLLMKKSQQAALRNDRDDAKKLSDRARNLILSFGGHDTADAIRNRTGPLLAELGFNTEAEALYQKLITLSDSPAAHAPLAILYIQTKKTEEAIKLAQEFDAKSPKTPVLMTAQLLSAAVRIKRPSAEVEKEVEAWLDKKIQLYAGKPELGGLLAAHAELLDAQEKYKDSITEYRRAIGLGAGEGAVNNLCMLIALYDPAKVDDAITMISEVIAIRGPVPTYLDSRAVAYIVKGGDATEKAVQDLKMAKIQYSRAVFSYHLAWAYDLQQKRPDRDRCLDEALRIGIESTDLHPLERDKFFKLCGPGVK